MLSKTKWSLMMYHESDRLILRAFSMEDLEPFYEYRSSAELCRFQDFETMTKKEAREFISDLTPFEAPEKGRWYQIAIALKTNNQLIGDCAIKFQDKQRKIAELGYTIHQNYHGQGFATEAIKRFIFYLKNQFSIHKINAFVDIRNKASIAVLRKLDFQQEAHFVKNYWDAIDQDWVDELQFGLICD